MSITYQNLEDNLSPMSLNGRITNITIKPIPKDFIQNLRDISEIKRRENQTTADMMHNETVRNAVFASKKDSV